MQRASTASACLGLAVHVGLAVAAWGLVAEAVAHTLTAPVLLALAAAASSGVTRRATGTRQPWLLVGALGAPVVAALALGVVLLVPIDVVGLVAWWVGATAAAAVRSRRPLLAAAASLGGVALASVATVTGAGAWSASEFTLGTTAQMKAGNGVVEAVDTHAFLIRQGVRILSHDGHRTVGDFLRSPDPGAPRIPAGQPGAGEHEPYYWRIQLGSRDADGKLKATLMPDHFFNWWTHAGKGTVAGSSGATWAEEQFAQAVKLWQHGRRSRAMYHLGAATHLVDDACAPPHASPFVPEHRAYEEWILPRQAQYAVSSGGIYRADFRVEEGHGGEEWSSSHTRGWLDECAHRAAGLQINTAQPPPDDPTGAGAYGGTIAHFKDTQRLTAGYLVFFFQTVGVVR